jgi:hypothetical protein
MQDQSKVSQQRRNPYVRGVDADGDGHAVGLLALNALDVNDELLAVHLL